MKQMWRKRVCEEKKEAAVRSLSVSEEEEEKAENCRVLEQREKTFHREENRQQKMSSQIKTHGVISLQCLTNLMKTWRHLAVSPQ